MDAELEVRPGDVLAGKYKIESLIGQGGMGVVVSATHLQLEERVAIKFLLPAALASPEAVARFAREARAAVKIKSEHVARVIDVGSLETGCPYMVMEYLHGQDLGAVVHERGAVPIPDAVEYVLQACEAIAEAHALGIVHRDLKPQNLFLARRTDGSACIKVLDFGISKVASTGSDLGMTKTTAVMGSPLYMSPEQMTSSRDVDGRTDIWALGAILYELLTGRVPFNADTMPQLCAMILQQPSPALRNHRPDAPEGLQNVISRCLEKDPAKRYANIADFAHALLPYAPRSGRTSVERVSRVMTAAGLSTSQLAVSSSHSESLRPGRETQSNFGQTLTATGRASWIAVVVAIVVAGGGAAALLLRKDEPSSATAENRVDAAVAPSASATSDVAGTSAPPASVAVVPAAPPSASQAVKPSATAAPRASAIKVSHVSKVAPRPPAPAVPQARPAAPAPAAPTPAAPAAAKKPVDLYMDRK